MTTFITMTSIVGKEITLQLDEQVIPERVDWNPYYIYQMIENKSNALIGNIVFRLGTLEELLYGGHIGYHIDEEFRGNGYAYQAVSLLMKLIKAHNYHEIIITCQPDNIASLKTITKLTIISFELKEIPKRLQKEFQNKETVNVYKVKVG